MKPFFITTFALFAFCMSAFAVDQTKLDEFASHLEAAIKAKDLNALSQLIYFKDAPQHQIDGTIHGWEQNLKMYTFDKITFHPLDDPSLNPRAIKPFTDGETIDGHLYGPNLKPAVLCIVFSKSEQSGSFGNTYVLGLAPDGSLKIVMQVPQR